MRYIIGILVALGMIGAIFFFILRGGGDGAEQQPQRIDLNRYANTDATVQLIVDGRVVANQQHRSYQISVNRAATSMQVFSGYENAVTGERTTPNNQEAYTNFIRSISRLGFTDVNTGGPKDERGYCPTGERYIIRLTENNREIYRAWTTSCGASQGNFNGDMGTIRVLFRQQVPEYYNLVQGSSLS